MVFFCFFFKSVLKSLDVLAAEQKINTKQKHPLCSPWIRPIMTLNEAPFLLCLVEGHLLHASVVNIHGIFPSFFSWNLTTRRPCCQLWNHQVELVQLHAQVLWTLPLAPVKRMEDEGWHLFILLMEEIWRLVVYPIVYRGFWHPRWLAGFLPSTPFESWVYV